MQCVRSQHHQNEQHDNNNDDDSDDNDSYDDNSIPPQDIDKECSSPNEGCMGGNHFQRRNT